MSKRRTSLIIATFFFLCLSGGAMAFHYGKLNERMKRLELTCVGVAEHQFASTGFDTPTRGNKTLTQRCEGADYLTFAAADWQRIEEAPQHAQAKNVLDPREVVFDPEFVAQLRQKKNKRAAKPRFSAPTGDTPQQTDAPTLVEQAVAANVLAEIDGLLTPNNSGSTSNPSDLWGQFPSSFGGFGGGNGGGVSPNIPVALNLGPNTTGQTPFEVLSDLATTPVDTDAPVDMDAFVTPIPGAVLLFPTALLAYFGSKGRRKKTQKA